MHGRKIKIEREIGKGLGEGGKSGGFLGVWDRRASGGLNFFRETEV
jgi:hypothetical protein